MENPEAESHPSCRLIIAGTESLRMPPRVPTLKEALTRHFLFRPFKDHPSTRSPEQSHSVSMSVPRDIREFLDGYPDLGDDPNASKNLEFYSNNLRCEPDGLLVDEIHQQWYGDYRKLEYNHGFIQWLFPIREHGMNWKSQVLQPHEIEGMKADPKIIARIIKSYELMLEFYGMRLVSEETGYIDRVLLPKNYKPRYRNFVTSSHNYLRISRILKCLSELGLEHLNAGFLLHVLNEQTEFNELSARGLHHSMDHWWVNCIRDAGERAWVRGILKEARTDGFVLTRKEYEKVLQDRASESLGRKAANE